MDSESGVGGGGGDGGGRRYQNGGDSQEGGSSGYISSNSNQQRGGGRGGGRGGYYQGHQRGRGGGGRGRGGGYNPHQFSQDGEATYQQQDNHRSHQRRGRGGTVRGGGERGAGGGGAYHQYRQRRDESGEQSNNGTNNNFHGRHNDSEEFSREGGPGSPGGPPPPGQQRRQRGQPRHHLQTQFEGHRDNRDRRPQHRRNYRHRGGGEGAGAFSSSSTLNPNAPEFHVGDHRNAEGEDNSGDLLGDHRDGNKFSRESSTTSNNTTSGENHTSGSPSHNENKENSGSSGRRGHRGTDDKPRNQREVLVDQLTRNQHECMVCCEKVRYSQPIWSCQRCFNVFHLACIRKWVAKSDDESGWRCPSCQSCYDDAPAGYYCFCGKTKNPKSSRHDVPHTCGQECAKLNPGGAHCTHVCISQCHPGPCPPCQVQQVRYCGCGRTNAQVLCGSKTILNCDNRCDRLLNCGVHRCQVKCHQGDCSPCDSEVIQACHCGSSKKSVPCTKDSNHCKVYSCSSPCKKPLSCGHHVCEDPCHPGACSPCKTSPEAVLSCPCGQTGISEACRLAKLPPRRTCKDRIPTCGKICLRILSCGDLDSNKHHSCQEKCHLSKECPPCKLTSNVRCRCGTKSVQIPCQELKSKQDGVVTCGKKCNRKRSCGKHKCNQTCCIDVDHICPIVCGRPLRCGIHPCSRLCHLNPCPPCDVVSFDELCCECGASIIYPPVPCGTRRPPCQLPCSRPHPCDHPVHHPCHSEPVCPPCTVLTEKWCHGRHELRKSVMCHISSLSCGLPCRKPLPCGRHTCPKICHVAGICLESGEICRLACNRPRTCGHACGAPCHDDQCPESKCKVVTEVTCPCGRRSDSMTCWKRENEYDRTVTWEYHKELKRLEELQPGKALGDEEKAEIMSRFKEKIPRAQVLECDKECAKLERNRKLAEALQLEHADTSTTTSIGVPNYSDFLTKFAKKNPQFVESVHKQLTELVLKAKQQSHKKNVTYGFNSMNRDKRHVVHEYSDHFGVLSESFDEEPNRNVVCFASKEKSYLPTVSLIDAVFRPPAVRSERLKPHDDVTFRPEKRAQIVGPSNWSMKGAPQNKEQLQQQRSTGSQGAGATGRIAWNIPGAGATGSADFPPL